MESMPCEGCNLQFTVFRRKRTCTDCKRYFCSNCLAVGSPKKNSAQLIQGSSTSQTTLCGRCAIFAKRPLLHNDLQQMKPKDLIFYLQSKHISTAGCVEKDELIRLVLNHIQEKDASPTGSADRSSSSTSFRNLKQSCQNFFSNLTENLQETFSAFDENNERHTPDKKPKTPKTPDSDIPKVSTRVLPTYASVQRNEFSVSSSNDSNDEPSVREQYNTIDSTENIPNFNQNETVNDTQTNLDEICLCTDFVEESEQKNEPTTSTTAAANATLKITIENGSDENSSQSSFEELGAIGGLSDETKTPADSNSGNSSNLDAWHIYETCPATSSNNLNLAEAETTAVTAGSTTQEAATSVGSEARRKLLRHRSESYLQLKRKAQQSLEEDDEPTTSSASKARLCCKRCGKQKSSLQQHVDHMRRLLEDAQMSEADIKSELTEFLAYLERRTNSVEEDESLTLPSGPNTSLQNVELAYYDDNAGIHVYGMPAPEETNADTDTDANMDADTNKSKPQRFINLTDFQTINQLECLSVKQLKEILMLNRVDYKGCVEKSELLDRVQRLWSNLKSAPALEQLPTDNLCKICMDAPIECVILECGHTATCTSCGKVLSECPICRQYIVRVVRIFRA